MLQMNFQLKMPPEQVSCLVLAYLGDAVYELYVRSYLLGNGRVKVNNLHKQAVQFVQAKTQAQVLKALEGTLDDTEAGVVRRGRNTKSVHVPKNAEVIDYRHATALECLFGYLYLQGRHERIAEIFAYALKVVEEGFPNGR
jgi:ribonuclease-3 family protein